MAAFGHAAILVGAGKGRPNSFRLRIGDRPRRRQINRPFALGFGTAVPLPPRSAPFSLFQTEHDWAQTRLRRPVSGTAPALRPDGKRLASVGQRWFLPLATRLKPISGILSPRLR
ncbi:protein of unknown function [Candidatus Methylocalor cossyra]|uniref:Uncharacterized protein n=1 Tax=Candidatus Methylocalor cossyra TaxID=3108543 RepID=A0ABM9NGL2_9GAMM